MNLIKKSLLFSATIFLAVTLCASPKKRLINADDDEQDKMMIVDEDSVGSSKNVRPSTRKEEEDRYFARLNELTAQQWQIKSKYEGREDSEECKNALAQIAQSLMLLEIKGEQLRNEVHPATDLSNPNWRNDPYWQ